MKVKGSSERSGKEEEKRSVQEDKTKMRPRRKRKRNEGVVSSFLDLLHLIRTVGLILNYRLLSCMRDLESRERESWTLHYSLAAAEAGG